MPCVTAQNGKRPDTRSDMHTMKMAEHITDPKCRSKKVKKLNYLPNISDDHTGCIVFLPLDLTENAWMGITDLHHFPGLSGIVFFHSYEI